MKIASKLNLSHAAMSFVVVVIAGVLVHFSTAVDEDFDRLSTHSLKVNRLINEIRFAGTRLLASTNEYVLITTVGGLADTGDGQDAEDQEIEEIDESIMLLKDRLREYSRFVTAYSPNEAAFLRNIEAGSKKLISESRTLIELSEDESTPADILEQKEVFEDAEQGFFTAIGAALVHEHREFAEARESLVGKIDTVVIVVWLGMAGAALFVMVFGAVVSRKISTPLARLAHATTGIAGGNLSTRVDATSGDEIGTLATSFNKMAANLEHNEEVRKQSQRQLMQADKLATLGRLAAGINHELAQPLNILRLAANTYRSDITESAPLSAEDQAEFMETVDQQVVRMAEIIEHMRIFARQDDDKDELFSPFTAVQNVRKLVGRQFAVAGTALVVEGADAGGALRGSMTQVEQVLLNLVANAADAIADVRARHQEADESYQGRIQITVSDRPQDGEIKIKITDNGSGVSDEVRASMFDPFFTTKEVGQGTGLGLSISYAIVDSMGGTISVENSDDGARVELSFPRH